MEQILKGFYKIKVTDDLDIYDKHTQVKIIKPNQDAVSVIEEFVTQATYKIDRTTLSDNNFQKLEHISNVIVCKALEIDMSILKEYLKCISRLFIGIKLMENIKFSQCHIEMI